MPETGACLAINFSVVGNGEAIYRNTVERGVGATAPNVNDFEAILSSFMVGKCSHIGFVRYRLLKSEKQAQLPASVTHYGKKLASGFVYNAQEKQPTAFKLEGLDSTVTEALVETFILAVAKTADDAAPDHTFKLLRSGRV